MLTVVVGVAGDAKGVDESFRRGGATVVTHWTDHPPRRYDSHDGGLSGRPGPEPVSLP